MDKREPFPWLIYCKYESLSALIPKYNKADNLTSQMGESGQAHGHLWGVWVWGVQVWKGCRDQGSLLDSHAHPLCLSILPEFSGAWSVRPGQKWIIRSGCRPGEAGSHFPDPIIKSPGSSGSLTMLLSPNRGLIQQ